SSGWTCTPALRPSASSTGARPSRPARKREEAKTRRGVSWNRLPWDSLNYRRFLRACVTFLRPMLRRYADALRFLNQFTDYERMASTYSPGEYNLDRTRRLLAALGNPERAFLSLHIAGTKGKGSTAHLAEAILREAGYRTGLYTSPHLVDMRERIRLGGVPVSEADFTRVMAEMEPHLRRLHPTYFETMTAAAFLLFANQGVEYGVVEVGLGGRLDATNVILPAACAITTIDYD